VLHTTIVAVTNKPTKLQVEAINTTAEQGVPDIREVVTSIITVTIVAIGWDHTELSTAKVQVIPIH